MTERKSIYSLYETSKDLEEVGSEMPLKDGSIWLIRRASSKAAQEALIRARKPYKGVIRKHEKAGTPLPDDIQNAIHLAWAADGLAAGFKVDPIGRDGQEIHYSPDNVLVILEDLPDIVDKIAAMALSADAYLKSEIAEDSTVLATG